MSWERQALEKIILLLVEKDAESRNWFTALNDLGVTIDKNSEAYDVLTAITEGWEWFAEDMESVQDGSYSKEEFISICFDHIQKKLSE